MRVTDDLEGEFKHVREEQDIAVAHTKNINRQHKNAQVTVSDMESYQIKLQSHIYDLTDDLALSPESVNKMKTNWNMTIIVKFHLDHMYNH